METIQVNLNDTIRVQYLLESGGVGVSGKDVYIKFEKVSNGQLYDFATGNFSGTPGTEYDKMTEDTELAGIYYYDFDTAVFSSDDSMLAYIYCGDPKAVHVKTYQIIKNATPFVGGYAVQNLTTGIITVGGFLMLKTGRCLTPSRATFEIRNQDGSVYRASEQVLSHTSGFFSLAISGLTPTQYKNYILYITIEYDGLSYYGAFPFISF